MFADKPSGSGSTRQSLAADGFHVLSTDCFCLCYSQQGHGVWTDRSSPGCITIFCSSSVSWGTSCKLKAGVMCLVKYVHSCVFVFCTKYMLKEFLDSSILKGRFYNNVWVVCGVGTWGIVIPMCLVNSVFVE